MATQIPASNTMTSIGAPKLVVKHRVTVQMETMLENISKEVKVESVTKREFSVMLRTFSTLFEMTEPELAAWHSALIDVLSLDSDPTRLTALLWMTSYHTKSSMTYSIPFSLESHLKQDPDFLRYIAEMCLSTESFPVFSLRKLHTSYNCLHRTENTGLGSKSTGDKVRDVLESETELSFNGELNEGKLQGLIEEKAGEGKVSGEMDWDVLLSVGTEDNC